MALEKAVHGKFPANPEIPKKSSGVRPNLSYFSGCFGDIRYLWKGNVVSGGGRRF